RSVGSPGGRTSDSRARPTPRVAPTGAATTCPPDVHHRYPADDADVGAQQAGPSRPEAAGSTSAMFTSVFASMGPATRPVADSRTSDFDSSGIPVTTGSPGGS